MAKWNDKEKAVALAYAKANGTHAHKHDLNEQKKARLDKLVKDIAAVASDPSKPKSRNAVTQYLTLYRMDPVTFEAHQNTQRERSRVKNPTYNPANNLVNNPKNNLVNNAIYNARTALQKREDSAEFWEQQAGAGLVRAREEVRSFRSVLLRHMLLLTANLLCSWPHLCMRISAHTLSKES
jgi:hypothetical protein